MILIEDYVRLMNDRDIKCLKMAIDKGFEYAVVNLYAFNAGAYIDIEYTNEYKEPEDNGYGYTTDINDMFDTFMRYASDEQKEIYYRCEEDKI